jgi:hypothetical protein
MPRWRPVFVVQPNVAMCITGSHRPGYRGPGMTLPAGCCRLLPLSFTTRCGPVAARPFPSVVWSSLWLASVGKAPSIPTILSTMHHAGCAKDRRRDYPKEQDWSPSPPQSPHPPRSIASSRTRVLFPCGTRATPRCFANLLGWRVKRTGEPRCSASPFASLQPPASRRSWRCSSSSWRLLHGNRTPVQPLPKSRDRQKALCLYPAKTTSHRSPRLHSLKPSSQHPRLASLLHKSSPSRCCNSLCNGVKKIIRPKPLTRLALLRHKISKSQRLCGFSSEAVDTGNRSFSL